jgi:hypothetical protein
MTRVERLDDGIGRGHMSGFKNSREIETREERSRNYIQIRSGVIDLHSKSHSSPD